MKTVELDGIRFDVDINGNVYQGRRVSSTVLDNVRLIVSNDYLQERRSLSATQALYWTRVSQVSMPHERGQSMGAPLHV